MIAFAVYSACVDPDRVLRALRPIAGRSALTATLVSRLVPVAAADAGRLRDAARLRGPGAAEAGRAPLARRLLAGSLDRAVDVAATLELRGYSLEPRPPRARRRREGLVGGTIDRALRAFDRASTRGAAVLGLPRSPASCSAPTPSTPTRRSSSASAPPTLALSALLVLSGLAPLRRKPSAGRRPGRRRGPEASAAATRRRPAGRPAPAALGATRV